MPERTPTPSIVRAAAASLLVLTAAIASAQSGSGRAPGYQPGSGQRYAPPAGSGQQPPAAAGSSARVANDAPVAFGGYCVVCLAESRKWMAGQPEIAVVHDGKKYLFPGDAQRQKFTANPARYTPALAGDDVVAYVRGGQRVPGKLELGAAYQDRYYFFATAANKQAFVDAPREFAKADLALGGDCVVCQVDMNHQMPGDPNVAAVFQGVTYYFPGEEQRQKFLANPARYAAAATGPGGRPARPGSGGGPSPGAGSGSGGR